MNRQTMAPLVAAGHAACAVQPQPQPQPQEQRRAGRFRETGRARALRAAMRALSRFAPWVAAQAGYRLLATPPRVAERPWQRELRRQARSIRIEAGGGDIAVHEWGAADHPAVLMVHGWGARATHMGRMIEPLVSAGLRVVAFDAPAHGESTGRSTDLIEFAGSVHRVARHIGPLRAVVAHSFGAAMVQLTARDWGLAAERHVLVSSFDHCRWFCEAFGRYAGLAPPIVERMQRMMVERHNGRFEWGATSVVEMLRRQSHPVLLIHDEDDEEIPFAHSVALHEACRGAELLATRGLGHHRLLGDRAVIARVVQFVSAA